MSAHRPKALIISTNYGTETDELIKSIEGLRTSNIDVTVAAVETTPIRTLILDAEPGPTVDVDITLADVDPDSYDALVIPGGTLNADALRINEQAQHIARSFASAGKPIASVCHGPWLLVDTELASNRTLTSYHSVRTDIANAGGTWVDEAVVKDTTGGFTLITSRTPFDMDSFVPAIVDTLAAH